jgi:chromosome segregation ATPase
MDDVLTKVLLGLVAAGFFTDIIKGFFQRKKVKSSANLDDATATQVIVTSTTALLAPLTNRLEKAEAQVQHLEGELRKVTRQAEGIIRQLDTCTAANRRITEENIRLRAKLSEGTT